MAPPAKGSLDTPLPVEHELVEEKANALARVTRALEEALADLTAFDATGVPASDSARSDLVDEAAKRLWYVMVQREAIGLRNHEALFRLYGVPREVRLRAGPGRRAADTR